MNGTTQERDLMNVLDVQGWEGVRAPASGTAPREQPDVLAAKWGVILNGELKSGGPPRNPEDVEVRDLTTVGRAFMATNVLVARWKGERAFYFAVPEAVDRTPSGHYSIPSDPDNWPWGARITYSPNEDDDVERRVDVHSVQVQPYQSPEFDGLTPADREDDPFLAWVADMGVLQEQAAANV